MGWFKRAGAETPPIQETVLTADVAVQANLHDQAEAPPISAGVEPETPGLPEVQEVSEIETSSDFLLDHLEAFERSRYIWRNTSLQLKQYRESFDAEAIKQTYTRDYHQHGIPLHASKVDSSTRVMIDNYAADLWRLARYKSLFGARAPRCAAAPGEQLLMATAMAEADRVDAAILNDFTDRYLTNIEDINTLAEQCSAGADNEDVLLRELRLIVGADWYHPDQRSSLLRAAVQNIKSRPEEFLGQFGEDIVKDEASKQLQAVKNLARFALIAAQKDPEDLGNIQHVLESTYEQWGHIEGIQDAYKLFVTKKIQEIEKALSTIAWPRTHKNVRNFIGHDDPVVKAPLNDPVDMTADRKRRRVIERKAAKSNGNINNTSLLDAIEEEAVGEQQTFTKERKLVIGKYGQNNTLNLEAVETGDVAAHFKMDHNTNLVGDVEKMIEWLQRHPISPASVPLNGKKLRLDNRTVRVWRMAPEKCPGIQVSGENRYTRVIYTFTRDEVAVLDVLTHEQYNKKWM
jgi:hypothetical protein